MRILSLPEYFKCTVAMLRTCPSALLGYHACPAYATELYCAHQPTQPDLGFGAFDLAKLPARVEMIG
jgi:hypothetical protein